MCSVIQIVKELVVYIFFVQNYIIIIVKDKLKKNIFIQIIYQKFRNIINILDFFFNLQIFLYILENNAQLEFFFIKMIAGFDFIIPKFYFRFLNFYL